MNYSNKTTNSLKKTLIALTICILFSITSVSNFNYFNATNEELPKDDDGINSTILSPNPQMNYVKEQIGLDPLIWQNLNLTGNTNASVAILGTGIDDSHIKFGTNSYADQDFARKIIGWQDFTESAETNPSDLNGQDTFASAVAFGDNSSESEIPTDGYNRISSTIGGQYYHPDLYDEWMTQGYFEILLGSFQVDSPNTNITINSTFTELDGTNYLENYNQNTIRLYYNQMSVAESEQIQSEDYTSFNYNITQNEGIYNVVFRYYVGFSNPANFTILSKINFVLENNVSNGNLSGVAPDTKIVSLKVLDENCQGYTSDLIEGLQWIESNYADYHIVAVSISLGDYSTTSGINSAIDDLISDGVMVFIAAGDSGIGGNALYNVAENSKAIVVGSTNEYDQLTYYTSQGKILENNCSKPDILAPGGSLLQGYREIIGADTNDNDVYGYYSDQVNNDTTMSTGTTISASILAAAYNMLIETLGGYDVWKNIMTEEYALSLKSYLLMTATETNQAREDNPNTNILESRNDLSPTLDRGTKDLHEGYGILNLKAAIQALNSTLDVDTMISNEIVSSKQNSTGLHSFARRVTLEQNTNYLINLGYNTDADLDLYIYNNESDGYGEPILVKSSTSNGNDNESIYFGTINETTEYIVVVKAVSGPETKFDLQVSELENIWAPVLSDAVVTSEENINDTLDEFEFQITYTDADDIPPLNIYLHIDEPGFNPNNLTLQQVNPNDDDYSDGAIYSTSYRFYNSGTYNYHFGIFDGNNFTRFPESSDLQLTVNEISNSVNANYSTDFLNVLKWDMDLGWSPLLIDANMDPRSEEYGNYWTTMYFGNSIDALLGNYNYRSLENPGSYSCLSPQIWVEEDSNAQLELGLRRSISAGDNFYIELRTNRTGNWVQLQRFTDSAQDWEYLLYNISEYSGNYVQIRFRTILDPAEELRQDKGIMISYFSLINQPKADEFAPELLNISVTPNPGSKYETYEFSCYYADSDNVMPELMYIEIGGRNYTMYNLLGDWETSYTKEGNNISSGGVLYSFYTNLVDVSNTNYTIYAKSSGKWYSSGENIGPTFGSELEGIFPFNTDPNLMTIYGTPAPNPQTAWLESDNSIHYIAENETWYTGAYDYTGYGLDWDVNLVTPLIYIPETSEEEYSIVLTYQHKLIFDPTIQFFHDEQASILISDDYGDSWETLIAYSSGTDIDNFTDSSINLNDYRGENVLIRYRFESDGIQTGDASESGWYIKNISVTKDFTEDRIAPTITFDELQPNMQISGTYTLNLTLIDNGSGIDDTRVAVYVGINKLDGLTSSGGIVSYTFDTRDFDNGEHTITVFVYDNDGNSARQIIDITIENEIDPLTWIIWVICIAIGTFIALLITAKIIQKKKDEEEVAKRMFSTAAVATGEEIPQVRKVTRAQRKAFEKSQRKLIELKYRDEAEKATPESEAKKPFTLHCKNCKQWFQSWDFEWVCPNCAEGSLYAAYECKLCGKWYFKDEPGVYFCNKPKCKIRLLK